MNLGNKTSRIALSVMAAITALNLVLALNFVGAATSTLAASLNSQNIFLFAGVEMILVLLAYIVCKNGPIPLLSRNG